MMMTFKNAQLLRRSLTGVAAAAAAVCLSSCGGGGSDGSDTSGRPDISPHKLVPVENDTAVIYIRGVILRDTGWEIGSSAEPANPGPADQVDQTETMLTLYFQPNGAFTMDVPFSTFVDDPNQDGRAAQAITRSARIEGGHWWQSDLTDNTPNLIMGVNFEGADAGADPQGASAHNPEGLYRWQYRGENICIQLRTRSNAPTMVQGSVSYRFDGAVLSGKMYVRSLRGEASTTMGGEQATIMFEDEYDFWGAPAIYFPGAAWTPGENDPLDPIQE